MYWATRWRCAASFAEMELPVSDGRAIEILQSKLQFERMDYDFVSKVLELSRSRIGQSQYRRGVADCASPGIVDCSSFVRWLYGWLGVELSRRSLLQRDVDGGKPVEPDDIRTGDLVFTCGSGKSHWWPGRPDDNVGHVAVATGEGTVVHANNRGVTEDGIESLLDPNVFRGVRRWVRDPKDFHVFRTCPRWTVRSSHDLHLLILQNL